MYLRTSPPLFRRAEGGFEEGDLIVGAFHNQEWPDGGVAFGLMAC